jgi:opacity protein-like surface antigen
MPYNVSRALTVAAALVTIASVATAQEKSAKPVGKSVYFGIGAGATVPMNNLSDCCNTGYHGAALVDWALANTEFPINLRFEGQYHYNGKKGGSSLYSDNFTQIAGIASLSYDLQQGEGARPYVIGGVGIYHLKLGYSTVGVNDSENDAGYNVGLGIKFPTGGMKTYIEGRYHRVSSNPGSFSYVPITIGVLF